MEELDQWRKAECNYEITNKNMYSNRVFIEDMLDNQGIKLFLALFRTWNFFTALVRVQH